MKPIIVNILIIASILICLVYLICRSFNLTSAIDPNDLDPDYSPDNADFDAEVEALIESKKTKN